MGRPSFSFGEYPVPRRRKVYEGKAKVLYEGPEPGTLVQYFKDDATAFNNEKHGIITGKGVLNNRISEYIMTRLGEVGVPTHFVRRLNMREQLIREVEPSSRSRSLTASPGRTCTAGSRGPHSRGPTARPGVRPLARRSP